MAKNSCIVSKLEELSPLSDKDRALLAELERDKRAYSAGQILKTAGQKHPPFFTLQSGWACSIRLLPDGQRQVMEIFVGAQIMGLGEAGSEVAQTEMLALTDISACPFGPRALRKLISESSNLAQLLLVTMARDNALLMERIMTIGKRRGAERLAHFLLEMRYRTRCEDDRLCLPFNQSIIGDALGMSSVHVSRSMSELKRLGLIETQGKVLVLPNPGLLAEYCYFCPKYLEVRSATTPLADLPAGFDYEIMLEDAVR
ncbi:MAG: Crp/Fnr family transcriptional regulator [Wenzhouxiangella sp.]